MEKSTTKKMPPKKILSKTYNKMCLKNLHKKTSNTVLKTMKNASKKGPKIISRSKKHLNKIKTYQIPKIRPKIWYVFSIQYSRKNIATPKENVSFSSIILVLVGTRMIRMIHPFLSWYPTKPVYMHA